MPTIGEQINASMSRSGGDEQTMTMMAIAQMLQGLSHAGGAIDEWIQRGKDAPIREVNRRRAAEDLILDDYLAKKPGVTYEQLSPTNKAAADKIEEALAQSTPQGMIGAVETMKSDLGRDPQKVLAGAEDLLRSKIALEKMHGGKDWEKRAAKEVAEVIASNPVLFGPVVHKSFVEASKGKPDKMAAHYSAIVEAVRGDKDLMKSYLDSWVTTNKDNGLDFVPPGAALGKLSGLDKPLPVGGYDITTGNKPNQAAIMRELLKGKSLKEVKESVDVSDQLPSLSIPGEKTRSVFEGEAYSPDEEKTYFEDHPEAVGRLIDKKVQGIKEPVDIPGWRKKANISDMPAASGSSPLYPGGGNKPSALEGWIPPPPTYTPDPEDLPPTDVFGNNLPGQAQPPAAPMEELRSLPPEKLDALMQIISQMYNPRFKPVDKTQEPLRNRYSGPRRDMLR
jgi:uncharacterized protein YidB (DUF937 family)